MLFQSFLITTRTLATPNDNYVKLQSRLCGNFPHWTKVRASLQRYVAEMVHTICATRIVIPRMPSYYIGDRNFPDITRFTPHSGTIDQKPYQQ
jgi:hypothetical protein